MPVFNVAYDVNQTVFYVSTATGVQESIVRSSTVFTNVLGTSIQYNIQYTKASLGSATVDESTLYPDIDTALAAYKVLLEC